jgi:hypothetical protein
MATQELEQNVCQQFGWSARYFVVNSEDQTRHKCWAVEIRMGLDHRKTFVSNDRSNDSVKCRKQGKKAAALVALEGLHDDLQKEMTKPIVYGLDGAVGHLMAGTSIWKSSDEIWNKFWKNPPNAVGVDTEGNALSPPVLVQVAADHFVILEAPNAANGLSRNLKRLFADDSIVKVFCDNRSQRDKTSLCLHVPVCMERDHVVDVEVLADKRMGEVAVARGLSKLVCLTMPELGVRIAKESGAQRLKDIGIFADIEQGHRPPLRSVHELTKRQQRYAALDAWCTLQVWKRLRE